MNFISCAYREWGIRIHESLTSFFPDSNFSLAKSPDELNHLLSGGLPDAIFCLGWSWYIEPRVTDHCWVVGIHPSGLPDYAGGSPIQNQILNGISRSKSTLFRLSSELDYGPILSQVPLSLEGHIAEIFDRLSTAGLIQLVDFIRDLPNGVTCIDQVVEAGHKRHSRIHPSASQLTHADMAKMNTRELYDFIRCREDPYPNVYLEDAVGKLIFKLCEFEGK